MKTILHIAKERDFMLFYKTVIRADNSNNIQLSRKCTTTVGGKRNLREHRHTEFEIGFLKSGSGCYTIKGKDYSFSAGDIFIISSNELHCITEMNCDEPLHLMNVQFEPRFIWSAENTWFDSNFLKIFFERNEIFENRLSRSNPATDAVRNILLEMETEAENQQPQYALMVKLLIIKMLVTIMRNYDYVKNSDSRFRFSEQSLHGLEHTMNYINNNLENGFTLDALAAEANMNRSYFCTIFKKLNGISPWDYITIKRIEKSIELLKTTDCTMLEIAMRCGFNNTANFNRAFKKVTGRVPGSYHSR